MNEPSKTISLEILKTVSSENPPPNTKSRKTENKFNCCNCMLCCIMCCFVSCYLVCPPCPSIIVRKLAFAPPKSNKKYRLAFLDRNDQLVIVNSAKQAYGKKDITYVFSEVSVQRELFSKESDQSVQFLREDIKNAEGFVVKTLRKNYIVGVRIKPVFIEKKDMVILFSQPNATDLTDLDFYQLLADTFCCDLYAYDYSGYGLSSGKPSEANVYEDVRAVYQHIIETRPNVKIVLMGLSIGTAVSTDLASKNPERLAGVILIAPLTSGCQLLRQTPGTSKLHCMDRFTSIKKVHLIKTPVLIIHGYEDNIIPQSHAEELHKKLQKPVEPLYVKDAGHQDILDPSVFPVVYERIEIFLNKEI